MTLDLSLILGTALGRLAGAMAVLITFCEYSKHQMAGWHLWKGALTAACWDMSRDMLGLGWQVAPSRGDGQTESH